MDPDVFADEKLVCAVADYLPKTSKVIFAVALTASPNSWCKRKKARPSAVSKSIISSAQQSDSPYKTVLGGIVEERLADQRANENERNRFLLRKCYGNETDRNVVFEKEVGRQIGEYYNGGWDILDFIDLEKSLAARLTDEDLGAALKCINAKKHLKRLNLTNCFNIVGHGLKPLKGSKLLETLDMGLVRQVEWVKSFDEARLDRTVVLRLLRKDILSVHGNSFRRLQIPYIWCNGKGCDAITRILEQYPSTTLSPFSFCWYFGFKNEEEVLKLLNNGSMGEDQNDYCAYCYDRKFYLCNRCDMLQCDSGCDFDGYGACVDCGSRYCGLCNGELGLFKVDYCFNDESCPPRCGSCRNRNCRNGTIDCNYCKAIVFDKILVENNGKQAEIDRLNREIEKLRVANDA